MKKIGKIDKICINLYKKIKKVQHFVWLVDEIMEQNRKIVVYTYVILAISIFTLAEIKCITGTIVLAVLFMAVTHIDLVKGWCVSVRKFFISVVMSNLYIVILIGYLAIMNNTLNKHVSSKDVFVICMIVYFIAWTVLSLIAKPEVAKISNEIVSVIFTILFTAGTYIISLKFSDVPSLKALENAYKTAEQLEIAMSQSTELTEQFFKSIIQYGMEQLFLFSLPFLCVSLFCTLEIDIKEYWLKKHKHEDFWEALETVQKEQSESKTIE